MSVNVLCELNDGATVQEVADAIGLAFGMRAMALSTGGFRVDGVRVDGASTPGLSRITVPGYTRPDESSPFVLFHHEWSRFDGPLGPKGRVGLMPPSTPEWIAVCRKLIEVFGGTVVENDCMEEPVVWTEAGLVSRDSSYEQVRAAVLSVTPVRADELLMSGEVLGRGRGL